MKLSGITAAIAFIIPSLAGAEIYRSWPIGVEREVDEGHYFTLISMKDGWRVWKLETKSGIDCMAAKSARGRPHPIPIGVGGALAMGTPFLQISKGYSKPHSFYWKAEHYGKVRVKLREPGAKFWDELSSGSEETSKYAEKLLEFSVTSWEYPELYVGLSEEKGLIDLKGMSQAIDAVDKCNGKG